MKIERLNENQIRCTLTKHDLTSRNVKISELAYGTDKARVLFRDMMEQAETECGFESGDQPLMIEAVPLNADCIVLTITKVDDPGELDTRFSKFAPSVLDEEQETDKGTSEIMDLFHKVSKAGNEMYSDSYQEQVLESDTSATAQPMKASKKELRVYRFDSLQDVIRVAHVVKDLPMGETSLYKETSTGHYVLTTDNLGISQKDLNRICNIFAEYGTFSLTTPYTELQIREHCETILLGDALRKLSEI